MNPRSHGTRSSKSAEKARQLFDASCDGDLRSVRRILKQHPKLARGQNGELQPLHVAAGNNLADVVELLLNYGADVNARDHEGRTPLHHAAELSLEAADVLILASANPSVVDNGGYTPLTIAITNQTENGRKIIDLLLKSGAQFDLTAAACIGDLHRVR
jgi:ankyrin repeat protein